MTQDRHQGPIGLLTPGWPGHNTPNGIATSVYHLALGLHAAGAPPVILAQRIDGPCPEGIEVIEVASLPWRLDERIRARLGDPDAGHRHIARSLAAAVRAAVQAHGIRSVIMEETNGWAGMVQPLVPVPVFVTLHGPWVLHKALQSKTSATGDRQREARENRAFAASAGLISPSRNVLETVEQATPLPAALPRIVLPNTLGGDPLAALSADQPTRDILFVGRFDRHKGGDTVLAGFAALAQTHPEARLTFVGPDRGVREPDGSTLHLAAALAALPAAVRARIDDTGPLDRAAVAALRARHAIALIASRYETFGYTVLEAMAAGQAIVCTAVGGPAEVLEQDRTALLIPPEDPQAMAHALAQLLEQPALAPRLGAAARAHLLEGFDPKAVALRTLNFITAAIPRP